MFNFEGKTSGIKNFQTDVFLANHWFEAQEQLIEKFHAIVSQYHLMIDKNIIENNNLTKLQRKSHHSMKIKIRQKRLKK